MSISNTITGRWNELAANLKQMEITLLKLLRHPDATGEEIAAARKLYADAYTRMLEKRPLVEDAVGKYSYRLSHMSLAHH